MATVTAADRQAEIAAHLSLLLTDHLARRIIPRPQ
jgi:hypothetical protein